MRAAPVSPETTVKIEKGDSLIPGEVVYCRQESQYWLIEVELNQCWPAWPS